MLQNAVFAVKSDERFCFLKWRDTYILSTIINPH